MKFLLTLWSVFCLLFSLHAQPVFEHIYPSNSATRLLHADNGSAYFYISSIPGVRTVFFFDSIHQPIQNTILVAPDSLPDASTAFFSYDVFDNDHAYEVMQFWRPDFTSHAYGFLYDDNGMLLHNEPFVAESTFPNFRVLTFDDGTRHMLVDKRIYDLDTYQLLYEFTDNITNPIGYKADGLEVKYCYINYTGQFIALNQDFSVFQTTAAVLDTSCSQSITILEQRDIDPDDDLEWMVWISCGQDRGVTVFSGSDILFSYYVQNEFIDQPSVLLPRFVTGIDAPKVHVYNTTTDITKVFDLISGDEQWNIPDSYFLRRTEPGTAFYSRTVVDANETQHTVYDMDYQPVATFTKMPGQTVGVFDVSRRTFDSDSTTVEIMIRNGTSVPDLQIIQQGNNVMFTIDSANSGNLSRLAGLPNKLFARSTTQTNWTKVYDLGTETISALAPATRFPLLVWPNPVSERLFLDPQTFPSNSADVRIFDPLGRIVWQQHVATSEVIKMGTYDWPAGLYVVQVVSGGKTTSRTVVKQP